MNAAALLWQRMNCKNQLPTPMRIAAWSGLGWGLLQLGCLAYAVLVLVRA